ncbi:MAG: ABC transporter ATP-binding protein [Eubacterium sp.]|nr:ABC transporter ATP-binding protein [Eubacterium sp.]
MKEHETGAIRAEHLKVGYDEAIIVPDFNAVFEKGKITSIIGSNGCGKSTLLKATGRIIPRAGGTVIINGSDISDMKGTDIAREMAILPQTPQAPGSLTCTELVSYGRFPYQKGMGRLKEEDREIVRWALEVTNMGKFADREIAALSGGQRQRVWIAMALAQQTGIILLDEPTTYLDLCHQLEVLELLKKLNEEQKATIIMVLHDLNLASRYSDALLAMKQGQIFAFGTPGEVMTSQMLAECFAIDGEVVTEPRWNKPVCISYDLLSKKQIRQ